MKSFCCGHHAESYIA